MYYKVIRQFINVDGAYLRQGDTIECDKKRAAILMRNGLIGLTADKKSAIIPELNIIETAEEKSYKRKYRKKNRE